MKKKGGDDMKHTKTAQRLSEALNEKKMRPQELADKSVVNKGSISLYMNGQGAPGNINAGKMAEVLGVNPMWLMGFDVDKYNINAPVDYLLNDIRIEVDRMDDDTRKRLLEYAKFLNYRKEE